MTIKWMQLTTIIFYHFCYLFSLSELQIDKNSIFRAHHLKSNKSNVNELKNCEQFNEPTFTIISFYIVDDEDH